MPASAGQSAADRHVTQRPRVEQSGVAGVPLQSVFATHCTQSPVVVLHFGVSPPHCVSLVQRTMHSKLPAWQIGLAAGQSALPVQSTHSWRVGWQRGFVAGHAESARHSTHDFVAGSQIGLSGFVQLVFAVHSMHWPVAVSQIGASPGHCGPATQLTWHS